MIAEWLVRREPTESGCGLKDLPTGWMWPVRPRQRLHELRKMAN